MAHKRKRGGFAFLNFDQSRSESPEGQTIQNLPKSLHDSVDRGAFFWVVLDHIIHQGFHKLQAAHLLQDCATRD